MIRGPGISKHENNVALSIKVKWTDFEVQSVQVTGLIVANIMF